MGSLTANKGYTLPTVGGDAGPLFAQEVNGNIAISDLNLGGLNSLNVGGNANVTLNSTQAQNLIQQFTGTLTGNITVFLPAVGSFYAIENATSGAFSLAVGCTGGGNTQQIPQGLSTWVWTDGSFTRLSNPPGWQEIATYIISGAASQVVSLPGPFRRFRLTLQGMTVSGSGTSLYLVTSTNAGSSFTNSLYGNAALNVTSTGVTTQGGASLTSALFLSGTLLPSSIVDGSYEIYPGASGAGSFRMRGTHCEVNNSSLFQTGMLAGASQDIGVNAVSVTCGGIGTFSGTIIVEGLP